MITMMLARYFSPLALLFICTFGCGLDLNAQSHQANSPPHGNTPLPPPMLKTSQDISEIPDIVMGSAEAPVVLIEYSCVNCTHCAHYHQQFHPVLKQRFIQSNKVQLIFKYFPLDYQSVEYMAVIASQPYARWYALYETALEHQKKWLGKPPKVLAKVLNISPKECESALQNDVLKKNIMAKRFNAEKRIQIDATPTFVILYRDQGDLKWELLNEGIAPDALLAKLEALTQGF